ncbi:helix-turn-helix domain-containing protein [Endozoicomonas numazuensis]|uniref:Bacteriophage CI repressor N-terminal domain-containing protein n=1 Tax=Endozoicomonas numazuensis TaxID=1137799 RepID=A0A081NL78_9GAMM|nr:helix-turn-helix domain-containing protein [Endozoicomonas numazuensis]KEQ19201.1 hypothetical protein GZ78_04185 [Endozoicomonas numazuensis]
MSELYQAKIDDFEEIIKKLREITDAKSDAAIARELGMTPQGFFNARKKGSIPFEKICYLAASKEISLDYLFFTNHKASIDEELLGVVVDCIRSDESELREAKLDFLLGEVSALYNSVVSLKSTEEVQKKLSEHINLMNKTILKRDLHQTKQHYLEYKEDLSDPLKEQLIELIKKMDMRLEKLENKIH